jgi:hypothetical protein
MKKDTSIEASHGKHKARLQQKIEQQMTRIEALIEELLADIDLHELKTKDRLAVAARFMALYQHAAVVEDALHANLAKQHDRLSIDLVMRRMRGEDIKEKLHVIDSELAPHTESSYFDEEGW